MASFLARRLLNPKFLSILPKPSNSLSALPNLKPSIAITTFYNKPISHPSSIPIFLTCRNFCSTPPPDPSNPSSDRNPETFKHQEIEGPTVERDLSPLANETREVLDKMRKSMYKLSTSLALLGMAHLSLGAWIAFSTPQGLPYEVSIQGIAGFAFPFATAFLMRHAIKPMIFFRKMEEIGRLQILTLAMQQAKGVHLLLTRTRVVAIFCVLGVSAGSVITILIR